MQPSRIVARRRAQHGFTLLELLVAVAIFTVLAVSGWQVFDSINRSKQRSEAQIQTLSQVQYAYQQMQRDMMQAVAYTLPAAASNAQNSTAAQVNEPTNGFQLNNNVLSFVRYADPDPRYQEIPTLERIEYDFNGTQLLRRRYTDLSMPQNSKEKGTSVPQNSQILTEVKGGLIQVLAPEPSIIYPIEDKSLLDNASRLNQEDNQSDNQKNKESAPVPTLPQGVTLSFDIQIGSNNTPIEWRFALPSTAPTLSASEPISDEGY